MPSNRPGTNSSSPHTAAPPPTGVVFVLLLLLLLLLPGVVELAMLLLLFGANFGKSSATATPSPHLAITCAASSTVNKGPTTS